MHLHTSFRRKNTHTLPDFKSNLYLFVTNVTWRPATTTDQSFRECTYLPSNQRLPGGHWPVTGPEYGLYELISK